MFCIDRKLLLNYIHSLFGTKGFLRKFETSKTTQNEIFYYITNY